MTLYPSAYRTHQRPAEIVNDYFISLRHGFFYVVQPEATKNLVGNPSLETNTTGYAAHGTGSIARVATQQFRGAYSLQVTPGAGINDGAYYGTVSLTALQNYAFSVDFKGVAGVKYQIYFANTIAQRLSPARVFVATGRWQRVWVPFRETATANRRVYVTKVNSASVQPFYIDGLQVENKRYPTTYCDGDLAGYVKNQTAFYWSGTPHASTSQRIAQTAAGGKPVKLLDLGFRLLSILGLGMAPLRNISTPYGLLDGALYQRTITDPRAFTLAGEVSARHLAEVYRKRAQLIDAFKPDRVSPQQPLMLLYEFADECDVGTQEFLELVCHLDGPPVGLTDNRYQERLGLNFVMYMPYIARQGSNGVSLDYREDFVASEVFYSRDENGVWDDVGTSSTGGVRWMVVGPDNKIYIGGQFLNLDNNTSNDGIAKYDPETDTFSPLGTGVNGTVYGIVFAPDGTLVAVGDFADASGIANTKNIAKWDGSSWSSITGSNTVNGIVYAAIFDSDGNLYVTGAFTNIASTATNRIAQRTAAGTWVAAASGGLDNTGYTLAVDGAGRVYVGGAFVNAGGSITKRAARQITVGGGDFEAANNIGFNNTVYGFAVDRENFLYAIGAFTAPLGIGKWNLNVDAAAIDLGAGATPDPSVTPLQITIDAEGNVYFPGNFTASGTRSLPKGYSVWNGSALVSGEFQTEAVIFSVLKHINRRLYAGIDFGGNDVYTAESTLVANDGSSKVYPRLRFTGPGKLSQVVNYTTGRKLYFDLELASGEIAVLDLEQRTFTSNTRGNIFSAILPGSDQDDWFLNPGDNYVSVFIFENSSGTTAVDMYWQDKFWSVDALHR